jgi:hypothetical protein
MALQNEALQAVGVSDGEWESLKTKLPEYMQRGTYLMLPWRDDKQQLNMLNLTYLLPGVGMVSDYFQRSLPETLLQNPLISLAGALKDKKKFTGAPLYYDWEPNTTKASKTLSYIWEQLGPAAAPGGTDWNQIYRSLTEQEGALSPEQAVAYSFGLKVAPIDAMAVSRRSAAIQKIHETEMTSEMRRELKNARTADDANAILEKYRNIRQSIMKP